MSKNNPIRDRALAKYSIDIDVYLKYRNKIFKESTTLAENILVSRYITCLQKEYVKVETENKHLKEQMKLKDELIEALKNNGQESNQPLPYNPEYKDGGDTL